MNIYTPDEYFLNELKKFQPNDNDFVYSPSNSQKGSLNNFFGRHHTEESKRLISENQKGWNHTEEAKEKIRNARLGVKRPDCVKEKISIANKGENHHMWGKKCSDEVKRKISETKKLNPYKHSEEIRKKISEAAKLRGMKKKGIVSV